VASALAGGLLACQTVDLGTPPSDINACRPSQQYFIDEIWPNVLNKDYGGKTCADAKCHDPGSGRPLTLVPPRDPGAIPLPPEWAANYRSASEQMNCSNVTSSELLVLPTGQRVHGGGTLFSLTDPEAGKIQMWVTAP
ncbi:MAG: hypothetical protein JWM82_2264, partial [Myxococcales bacterium]|nr:hypothetical protein [Myxococcales bacterium]